MLNSTIELNLKLIKNNKIIPPYPSPKVCESFFESYERNSFLSMHRADISELNEEVKEEVKSKQISSLLLPLNRVKVSR